MGIFEIRDQELEPLERTSFQKEKILERRDLQRMLRKVFPRIDPDVMILDEEFGTWEGSKRRIDLLGIDRERRLVVIEIKRTEDGDHMELQAVRYAAMAATMTFEQAVSTHAAHLLTHGQDVKEARQRILDFLGEPRSAQPQLQGRPRIILVSSDFSPELKMSVEHLNSYGLGIQCVSMRPMRLAGGQLLVDVQSVIPPAPIADSGITAREPSDQQIRRIESKREDDVLYDLVINDVAHRGISKGLVALRLAHAVARVGCDPEEAFLSHAPATVPIVKCLEGKLTPDQVERMIGERASTRYFCDEAELIHFEGATFVVRKSIRTAPESRVRSALYEISWRAEWRRSKFGQAGLDIRVARSVA